MSDWTYKGVPAPILPEDGSWRVDLGSWSKGVDAALDSDVTPMPVCFHSLYELILDQVGYVDGAETSADGSADNDLAHERAQAVIQFIELVKGHSVPESLLPKIDEEEKEYKLRNGYDRHLGEPFFEVSPGKFLYGGGTRESAMAAYRWGVMGWSLDPFAVANGRYTFDTP